MAAKKSFVLRMDAATFEALEKWAADEFRSVNGQLEWIVANALKDVRRLPKGGKKAAQGTTQAKEAPETAAEEPAEEGD